MNQPTNRSELTSIPLGIVEEMEAEVKLLFEIGKIPIGMEKVSARTQRRRLASEVLAQTGIPPVGGAR